MMSNLEKEFLIHEIKGLLNMLTKEVDDYKFQLSSVDTKETIQKRLDKVKSIVGRIEEKINY